MTLRQAGAQLEVRLDRCQWQAVREQADTPHRADAEQRRRRQQSILKGKS
jgi:hypothetical protein